MGTRAMITIDGKPFVATHYDGYPTSLGEDLIGTKDVSGILRVARKHSIDFANLKNPHIRKYRESRYRNISKKTGGKYTPKQIKELDRKGRQLTFGVTSSHDLPIASIKNYDDWAEYEYDFDTKTGTWRVRARDGSWKENHPKAWGRLERVVARETEKENMRRNLQKVV